MKKSFLILLLTPILLAGCDEKPKEDPLHSHEFSQDWKNDSLNHWHECPCGEKSAVEAHKDGNNDFICDVCGYALPKPVHVCEDKNNDHSCDECQKVLSVCVDNNHDGFCDICNKPYVLKEIKITIKKVPNKTNYYVGEVFDPIGMVVNVTYEDGSYKSITDYTYSTELLQLTDTKIIVSYNDLTAEVAISVTAGKPVIEEEYTATIKLSGNDFNVVATKTGVQFDDSSYSRNVESLKEYCDSTLEYRNLIKSINCTNLNTCEWEQGVALCIGMGYYANDNFKPGLFKWNSDVKIYRVELKARAYTKRNSYSGDIIDSPAHVQLDGDDLELMPSGSTKAEIKTISKDYSEGVNSFSMTSTGARVAVEQITITWRG